MFHNDLYGTGGIKENLPKEVMNMLSSNATVYDRMDHFEIVERTEHGVVRIYICKEDPEYLNKILGFRVEKEMFTAEWLYGGRKSFSDVRFKLPSPEDKVVSKYFQLSYEEESYKIFFDWLSNTFSEDVNETKVKIPEGDYWLAQLKKSY